MRARACRLPLLLAACLLVPRPSQAAGKPASAAARTSKPPVETLQGEALAAYGQARLLAADGDYAGALAKFRRAYELSQEPRLIWNMAACEKEQRHYARASALVEQYLREAHDLSTASRAEAEETLEALQDFWSELTLRGAPAGAHVWIDAEEVGRTPWARPLRVDLGARRVRVELAGYEPFEHIVEVAGDTPIELEVKMVAAAARLTVDTSLPEASIAIDGRAVGHGRWQGTVAPGAHRVEVAAADHRGLDTRIEVIANVPRTLHVQLAPVGGWERNRTWVGWSALGLGVAGLATGAITGMSAMNKLDELDCVEGRCPAGTDPNAISEYDNLRTASSVGLVAGGVLAAVGVTVLWVVPPGGADSKAVGLYLGPGHSGVRGSF